MYVFASCSEESLALSMALLRVPKLAQLGAQDVTCYFDPLDPHSMQLKYTLVYK